MADIKKIVVKGLIGITLAGTSSCFVPNQESLTGENHKKEFQAYDENRITGNFSNSYTQEPIDITPYAVKNFEFKYTLNRQEIAGIVDSAYAKINSRRKIPPYMSRKFFEASALAESSGDIYAISEVGARGLMQLTEGAWKQVSTEPYDERVFDPNKNVDAGIKYYLWVHDFCSKNYPNWKELSEQEKVDLLNAGYNFGPPRLMSINWNIENTCPETRTHVAKIDSLISS